MENMENQDLKKISAAKAAPNDQMVIDIPKLDIGFHCSSLTDYLDKAVDYNPKMLSAIDDLIIRFHLGAVIKLVNGHHGTVLPRISRNNKVVGGSVLYFDTGSGAVLRREALVEHLYSWYCFDYYTDDEVFFGEHLFQTSLSPSCKRKRLPCSVRLPNPPSTGWQSGKAATSPMA